MPIKTIELDQSTREEEVTLVIGKNLVIKLIENEQVKKLISEPIVQILLKTKNLCHKDFVEKMNKLIKISPIPIESVMRYRYPGFLIHEQERKEIVRRLKKDSRYFIKEVKETEKSMLNLEFEIKKFNPSLEILQPVTLQLCNVCRNPLFTIPKGTQEGKPRVAHVRNKREPFRRISFYRAIMSEEIHPIKGEFRGDLKCIFCNSLVTRDKACRLNIHEVHPSIREVWTRGIWLEEFLASLLRRKEWQTWTHLHMLGMSGIPHEIDILGIKKGFILIAECKTGKLARSDIFTFSTKITDLKSHVALFMSLLPLPDPETREFLTKNPMVILLENACEFKEEGIEVKLSEGALRNI
jgi:hypothetical protein